LLTASLLLTACNSAAAAETFAERMVDAAIERTRHQVRYDGSYRRIAYPNGDVPADVGVCTDLLVRAFRSAGIELQRVVHEDMRSDFDAYPSQRVWGLTGPDPNIDHRRVPNLQAFLSRHGRVLPVSANPADYSAGDIVTWNLPGNLPHIGIVTDRIGATSGRPLIAHNIGYGPVLEDMLLTYEISGHYRYQPDHIIQFEQ
jgi:uncharacterized protein YijF (DUF1287 family)